MTFVVYYYLALLELEGEVPERLSSVNSSQVHVLEAVAGSAEVRHFSFGVGLALLGSEASGGEAVRLLRLHADEGRGLIWLRAFLLLLFFHALFVAYYVWLRAVETSVGLGRAVAKSTGARMATYRALLLLVCGAVLGVVLPRAAERVDLTRELILALLQNHEFHLVLLSFREAELLLAALAF